MSEYGQPQPYQPKPKKKHTVRNIVLGVFVGIFLVIGGCTALVGGALSSQDAKAPVTVTSQAGTPATVSSNPPATTEPVKPTVQPSPKVTHKPAPKLTASQEQAIGSAESLLSFTAFSRKGLIHQLTSQYGEGFSVKDATFAVDHITVNWNEQAAAKAKELLSIQHFSRKGLIHQLESAYGEQFTHSQAVYGVTKAGL